MGVHRNRQNFCQYAIPFQGIGCEVTVEIQAACTRFLDQSRQNFQRITVPDQQLTTVLAQAGISDCSALSINFVRAGLAFFPCRMAGSKMKMGMMGAPDSLAAWSAWLSLKRKSRRNQCSTGEVMNG